MHALGHGYYIVPYERFNLEKNSNGFEFGVDLPERKRTCMDTWVNDINKMLLKQNVVPKELLGDISSSFNGYHSITVILRNTHPAMLSDPYLQCLVYPFQQDGQGIHQFYHEFNDVVNMKKIFFNEKLNYTDHHMQTIFIAHCKHAKYLFKVSQNDRSDANKRAKLFAPGCFLNTIQMYMNRPDSPSRTGLDSHLPSTNMKPFHRLLHELDYDIVNEIETEIKVLELDDTVEYSVHKIYSSTQPISKTNCVICDGVHTFADCGILKTCPQKVRSLLIRLAIGLKALKQKNDDKQSKQKNIMKLEEAQDKQSPNMSNPDLLDFHQGKE